MQAVDTRAAILDGAARLYADLGYSAVSMRDVARATGVTPAALYHHFTGKDELIREAVAHVFASKTAPLAAVLDGQGDGTGRLDAFVDFFVHLLAEDRVFFRLLVRELVDADAERLRDLTQRVFDRPFRLVGSLADPRGSDDERFLTTVSIISVILGHVQLAALLPHLPGGRRDHAAPSVIAGHVSAVLRRAFHDTPGDP
jgi:AcrR family transcriptional regulator